MLSIKMQECVDLILFIDLYWHGQASISELWAAQHSEEVVPGYY